jgi:hypothetical protein
MIIPLPTYGAPIMLPDNPLEGLAFIAPVLLTKMLFMFIPDGPTVLETLGAPPAPTVL